MDYKIIMPVLSDTMDKGKLVKWHVKPGDEVHAGDVIADVESDKAIMEVQTFKDGVVKELLVKEGEEVPVKAPIAIIDTSSKNTTQEQPSKTAPQPTQSRPPHHEPSHESTTPLPSILQEILHPTSVSGEASPAAKAKAAKAGIDIEKLQKEGELPKPAHLKDIEAIELQRYFTPKALKLLRQYNIDPHSFKLDHKIDTQEVESYIKAHNIPQVIPLSKNRSAVIKTVENAAKKPTYFIFEEFHINTYENIKLTSILLKKIGDVMQRHPLTRARLENGHYAIYPHSNISVAVAKGDDLYMVVCKNVETKSLEEIDGWVRGLKKRDFSAEELTGSTFGLSNLGMFGIERFSAMINQNDSAIAAFGALENRKIAVTFTFDHRILNGVDAAKFVSDLKKEFGNV